MALNDCEEEDEDEDEQKGGAQLSFEHALNPEPRANSNVAADWKVRAPAPPFATRHPQKPPIGFRKVPVLRVAGRLPMLSLLEYIPGLAIPLSLRGVHGPREGDEDGPGVGTHVALWPLGPRADQPSQYCQSAGILLGQLRRSKGSAAQSRSLFVHLRLCRTQRRFFFKERSIGGPGQYVVLG
jgi:hypothetical protein